MFLAYLKVLLRHSKRRHRHRAICRSTGIQRRKVIETAGANAAFSSSESPALTPIEQSFSKLRRPR